MSATTNNECVICKEYNDSVGIATGENGVEMRVCDVCDIDGSNYNGWGDNEYCCCCRNPDEGVDGGCKCDCHSEFDTDDEEEKEEEKCVPACATCGYEMDPFLICLLNFGNHNQSVYHCTECLDERAALLAKTFDACQYRIRMEDKEEEEMIKNDFDAPESEL